MKHSAFLFFPPGAFLLLVAAVPVSVSLSTIPGISPAVGYTDGTSVAVTITAVNGTTIEGGEA